MNIFEKIQTIRVELKHKDLKMSGRNKFANYDYMELDDFCPALDELMLKYKITAIPTFSREKASLTAIDCEKPEDRYTIESPFGTADLKGCHEVQCIGAVETYQRRYLYQAMFDISESDGLNKSQGDPSKPAPKKTAEFPSHAEDDLLPGEEKPAAKSAKPVDEKDPNGAARCAKIKEVFNAKRKAKELTTDTQKAIKKLLVENSEDGAGMLNENYSARVYDQLEELLGIGE